LAVGVARWVLVAGVVGATLDVAPKGLGYVGCVVPKGLEGMLGCMWGCIGRLGKMVIEWDMPKSNEVDVKPATEFAMAGLAAGWCGYS